MWLLLGHSLLQATHCGALSRRSGVREDLGSHVNFPDCPVYNALSLTLPDDDVATVVSTPGGFAECGGSFAWLIRPTQRPVVDPAHVTPCRAAALQVLGGGWWNAQAGTAVTDLNIKTWAQCPARCTDTPRCSA